MWSIMMSTSIQNLVEWPQLTRIHHNRNYKAARNLSCQSKILCCRKLLLAIWVAFTNDKQVQWLLARRMTWEKCLRGMKAGALESENWGSCKASSHKGLERLSTQRWWQIRKSVKSSNSRNRNRSLWTKLFRSWSNIYRPIQRRPTLHLP